MSFEPLLLGKDLEKLPHPLIEVALELVDVVTLAVLMIGGFKHLLALGDPLFSPSGSHHVCSDSTALLFLLVIPVLVSLLTEVSLIILEHELVNLTSPQIVEETLHELWEEVIVLIDPSEDAEHGLVRQEAFFQAAIKEILVSFNNIVNGSHTSIQ